MSYLSCNSSLFLKGFEHREIDQMQKVVSAVGKENRHCEFVYGSSELNLLHLPFFRNGKDTLEDFDYNDSRCNSLLRPVAARTPSNTTTHHPTSCSPCGNQESSTCVTLNGSGIQLAVGPQPLRLRNNDFGFAQRIMVKRLATSRHDPLGITDSACKNQLVVVSVQYGPFNTYIPIRSTTIGKSRVARDPIAMHTSWRSNSDIASVNSIGYPRMRASDESSTTKHRLLHASGPHPIPPPNDPNLDVLCDLVVLCWTSSGFLSLYQLSCPLLDQLRRPLTVLAWISSTVPARASPHCSNFGHPLLDQLVRPLTIPTWTTPQSALLSALNQSTISALFQLAARLLQCFHPARFYFCISSLPLQILHETSVIASEMGQRAILTITS
ncbi:hypothetical protein F511_34861 [Dorcoceras hygrometricum]|uniref:Uncharacterized protein n=1 Tax=Dorcoceras hygrometricum TaxID=472368 RepID=A0A2Z7DEE7_9LAMI|nr:hypothetical protein F511_34861 [Dorcoceras hygrometricum]